MTNILSLFRLENIKSNALKVSRRFPVSTILILIISAIFVALIHGDFSQDTENILTKSIFTIIVTFFLSVGTYIASESYGIKYPKHQLTQAFPLIFGVLFYMVFSPNLDNFENFLRFIISLFGIIGFLFFAPYIKDMLSGTGKQDTYYSYFYKVSVVFLWSCILGGALFALGAIAISAVFTLFDLSWTHTDKLYGDWAVFALSFITPLFALTQLPQKTDFHKNTFNENAFFSFLVKFVATPFIVIYFLILYAYSVKVLLNFNDWPKGEVSWMVIGFSIFWYITYIFSYIFDEKEKLIHLFRKYFPYVVVPQIGMLFYAIYLRINQYDITINRYFVVVFGIWLLLISLYFIFSKKKFLGYLFTCITLFTIVISIWPWSVYSFPEARQLARLESKLVEAKILQDGTITPLKNEKDIDGKLSGEIYDGISYLCNLNDCESIKTLFSKEYTDFLKRHRADFDTQSQKDREYYVQNAKELEAIQERKYQEPGYWEIITAITSAIKVRQYYANETDTGVKNYSFYKDYKSDIFPLQTTGYSQVIRLGYKPEIVTGLYAEVDSKVNYISLKNETATLDTFDLKEVQKTLIEKYGESYNTPLSKEDLTFTLKWQKYEVVVLFENISFSENTWTDSKGFYASANGYMLIK